MYLLIHTIPRIFTPIKYCNMHLHLGVLLYQLSSPVRKMNVINFYARPSPQHLVASCESEAGAGIGFVTGQMCNRINARGWS